MIAFLALLIAYLIGSVSSAVIVSRMMGLPDPRTEGSGNPGATNVLRLGGKRAGIFTLVGDVLKGVVALSLANVLSDSELVLAVVFVGVVLGHMFPVFFAFKGGKGIATAGGAILTLAPIVGVALIVVWLAVAFVTRYSSAASLLAAAGAPFLFAWFTGKTLYVIAASIIGILIFIRHKTNIQRLASGNESKINLRKQ